MSERAYRTRDGYWYRRVQPDPAPPGIWPDLRTALFDVALALLFWVGIIAAIWWWLA